MAAIVIYEEANVIAIISILISMLSVASKSFVFSIATALTLKQLFFNWLSAVTDFFGLFFVVSWVFYEPNDENLKDAFALFKTVWLYRIYFCTAPLVGATSVLCYVGFTSEQMPSNRYRYGSDRYTPMQLCCARVVAILGMAIMWAAGVIASSLSLEIMTWCWPCGTLWYLGTRRFPQNKVESEFYFTVIGWIKAARKHRIDSRYKGCTSYTKYQDKMMRLSSFHHIVFDSDKVYLGDNNLLKYLTSQMETQYMNVTMKDIRMNAYEQRYADFLKVFWGLYGGIFTDVKREFLQDRKNGTMSRSGYCQKLFYTIMFGIITFFLGPIYLFARILTLFYPIWIVLYLYFMYDINIWKTTEIDLFQVVMISIYLGLCGIIWILFILNLEEQYLMHHIVPSNYSLSGYGINDQLVDTLLKNITNHYFGIVVVPIRRAIVIDHFGPDLGPIILGYLPAKDEYESGENVPRVKTV